MLANIIRIGKKEHNNNGKIKYISLPAFWRSKEKAEISLNMILEHNRMIKKYENLKTEEDKKMFFNEIKNKEWFYSEISKIEESAVLAEERPDLKTYKEKLKDLCNGESQNSWKTNLFLMRDDGERFVMPVLWNNNETDLYNVKIMKK